MGRDRGPKNGPSGEPPYLIGGQDLRPLQPQLLILFYILERGGEVPVGELKRRFGSSTTKRVISKLREAGLVYRRRKLVNARTGRRAWVVRASPVLRLFCSKVRD